MADAPITREEFKKLMFDTDRPQVDEAWELIERLQQENKLLRVAHDDGMFVSREDYNRVAQESERLQQENKQLREVMDMSQLLVERQENAALRAEVGKLILLFESFIYDGKVSQGAVTVAIQQFMSHTEITLPDNERALSAERESADLRALLNDAREVLEQVPRIPYGEGKVLAQRIADKLAPTFSEPGMHGMDTPIPQQPEDA